MTTDQRHKARQRAAVRAAIDGFLARPCRLPPQQTRVLLSQLCAKLGYCLAPDDYESLAYFRREDMPVLAFEYPDEVFEENRASAHFERGE